MSCLTPRLTRLCGASSLASPLANRLVDDIPKLTRSFAALTNISDPTTSSPSFSSSSSFSSQTRKVNHAKTFSPHLLTSPFHTSVFERLLGNPKSIVYDLVPQEPKKPEEWEYRYVRYGKSEKQWRPKIPMGIPDLDAIPEGHVDRAGNPYTTEGLPWNYTKGLDPVTRRRSNHRIGEGVRRFYRMVDYTRSVPAGENSPFVERVLDIIDDETRNPYIALVANGNFKRYIVASENMKVGDLVKTYNEIPKNPVQAFEGDAYPIGALAVGTVIHNLEKHPGKGGFYAITAGSYGTVLKKEGDRVIVSMYKKKKTYAIVHNKEISVDERCMATVGRVSNVNYHLIPIGSPTMLRKLGYRPRSGLFQLKDGRYGRRIHPPPPLYTVEEPRLPYIPIYKEK